MEKFSLPNGHAHLNPPEVMQWWLGLLVWVL